MSTRPHRPGFLEGVRVALVYSLAGAAGFHLLRTMLIPADALALTLAGLGLAYLIYLLRCSGEPVGRVTVVMAFGRGPDQGLATFSRSLPVPR